MKKQKTVGITLTRCYYCGKDSDILMTKYLVTEKTAEKMRQKRPVTLRPCNECVEHMKMGVLTIVIEDNGTWDNNIRTGIYAVLKADIPIFKDIGVGFGTITHISATETTMFKVGKENRPDPTIRACFMTRTVAEKIGLISAVKRMEEKQTV
jgi:hypothetical protein